MHKGKNTMECYKFNIKFISPLLISGAGNKIDQNGLSGKALRGCWRFWCRAIIGGMIEDMNNLYKLESKVFGSADSKIGAKFRLIVEERDNYPIKYFNLGFPRGNKNGFEEGASYSITIIPRSNMGKPEINVLLATIWLWGNLGAVGNRSRRGFGSPIIYMDDKYRDIFNMNESNYKFPIDEKPFTTIKELEDHLKIGLTSIWEIYRNWITNSGMSTVTGTINTLDAPKSAKFFYLRSIEQIAVGINGFTERDDAIVAVHGRNRCEELGSGPFRMASPVFIRFHKIDGDNQNKYLPIFTWCEQEGVYDDDCAIKYLRDIINKNKKRVFTRYLSETIK